MIIIMIIIIITVLLSLYVPTSSVNTSSLVTKGSVGQKLSDEQRSSEDLYLRCGFDFHHSNPAFSQDNDDDDKINYNINLILVVKGSSVR